MVFICRTKGKAQNWSRISVLNKTHTEKLKVLLRRKNGMWRLYVMLIFPLRKYTCKDRDQTNLTGKNVGFLPYEFIEKPWDCWVLFFSSPILNKLQYLYTHFVSLTKRVWIWTRVGDRLKIDCQDEEDGFLRIAAYHCCNPHPQMGWNTKAVWVWHCQS